MKRRSFIVNSLAMMAAGSNLGWAVGADADERAKPVTRVSRPRGRPPNILFVFADQLRAQALGYAGDPNAITPHIDRLAACSLNFRNAVSGCPVCTPYRGSLLTGQTPLTHGLFVNDVPLQPKAPTLGELFKNAGYDTAWIGKWHVDGHGRSSYIPPERRLGFDTFMALECTHDYHRSEYYEGDSGEKKVWGGYDTIAQTRAASEWIRGRDGRGDRPFLLMLSWGTPHEPYDQAPERFRVMHDPGKIRVRPNVPGPLAITARRDLAGYYAHCTALDTCVGDLLVTLESEGIAQDTIVVFTSDHGDMHYSQGQTRKQRPWDESIRVPLLVRWPRGLGSRGRVLDAVFDAPDWLPTLLGLAGLDRPEAIEGHDYSAVMRRLTDDPGRSAAIIACYQPFADWARGKGGREYRGLRTVRHTYVRDQNGPWLLYDNVADPCQLDNLVNKPDLAVLRADLDGELIRRLNARRDAFAPGVELIRQWGYPVDDTGTVPYEN